VCLIIAKPAGEVITPELMEWCSSIHTDGFGFMYPHKKKLKIHKFLTSDKLIDDYQETMGNVLEAETPVIMHFRAATRGSIKLDNCHPFRINTNVGMVHNGTLAVATEGDMTDSETYARKYLGFMSATHVNNECFLNLLEEAIPISRMAFMNHLGQVLIVNSKGGHHDMGLWFSNNSYKPAPPKRPHNPPNLGIVPPRTEVLSAYDSDGTRKYQPPVGEEPISSSRLEMTTQKNGVRYSIIHDDCPWCGTHVKLTLPFLGSSLKSKEISQLECPNCSGLVACPICNTWYSELSMQLSSCVTCGQKMER
jgi:hypothetical protein